MHAALILAAGAATRFGALKQLALYQDRPLLAWAIRHAQQAGCDPVWVVTGQAAEAVQPLVMQHNAIALYNDNWSQGMAHSVRFGLEKVIRVPDWTQLFLLPADMPWLTDTHLVDFKVASQAPVQQARPRPVVAVDYPEGPGLPALLSRTFIEAYLADTAPRRSLRKAIAQADGLITLPVGPHTKDVDFPDDLLNAGFIS